MGLWLSCHSTQQPVFVSEHSAVGGTWTMDAPVVSPSHWALAGVSGQQAEDAEDE